MKTIYKLLILLALLLGIAWTTKAQDTTRTPIGMDIDFAHVYIRKDTIHNISFIYNYYPTKMYFSVNGGKVFLLARKQVITTWSAHFDLIVTRKKYKRIYKI